MRGAAIALAVAVLAATPGCLDLGRVAPERGSDLLEEVPALGERDFSQAHLVLDAEGCRELQLFVQGDAERVRERLDGTDPAVVDGESARLVLGVTRCEAVTADNRTLHDVALADVAVPVQTAAEGGQVGRTDRVLWTVTDDDRLRGILREAGVPARGAEAIRVEREATYGVADRYRIAVESQPVELEGSATSVTVGTQLPFGASASLARARLLQGIDGTELALEQGLDVDGFGGLSGSLDLEPSTPLRRLVGTDTADPHGVRADHDARIAVTEAG